MRSKSAFDVKRTVAGANSRKTGTEQMGNAVQVLTRPQGAVSTDLLVAALENCPDGIALAENEHIVYANSAFAELLGCADPGEIDDKALASLRPENYACSCDSSADPAATAHGHPAFELIECKKHAGTVRIESRSSTFTAGGRNLVVLNLREAVPQDKGRVVHDGDRRFRAIFDAAPVGMVQCGTDGRVIETNSALESMAGRSREDLRGTDFRDLLHPDDGQMYAARFEGLAKGTREAYEQELRFLGKSGAGGWVHLKVSLVRGFGGAPQFAIAMIEDITERKRSEQRLREAQKMEAVGRLVGGVAHDFNNLLTGIMLYCDLLVAGLDRDSRLHHHAEEIRMAGEQGAALIQQLLAIARQQVVEPQILCLNQTITSTRNLLSRLIGEKIDLQIQLEDRLGNVKMDPAQVQQILFNLVLNARDAISESGRIVVITSNCSFSLADPGPGAPIRGVMLAVTDTGCGMSAETRSHLFEPFFTTKTPGRGNGLGLATVYSIVKNSGGAIQVESTPAEGTRFKVFLPRVADAGVPAPSGNRFSPGATGETILLVEDNVIVRQAAKRILIQCGYHVLEAGTGAEAMALVRDHPRGIHLLLADLVMRGMSGRELAQRLTADDPDLRILYMSGYEPQSSEDQDPVVFFRKPFTGAALLEKVRQVLDTHSPSTPKKQDNRKREQS